MSLSSAHIRIALLLRLCCGLVAAEASRAAEPVETQDSANPSAVSTAETDVGAARHFNVEAFEVEGNTLLATNILIPVFSKYTGTNISLDQLVQAAAEVQSEYRVQGHPAISIVISQQRITNGIVTMNVFEGAYPQIVVSGTRYLVSTNGVAAAASPTAAEIAVLAAESAAGEAAQKTNTGPTFVVKNYVVSGNSLLPPEAISAALTNATGAFGTNVSFTGIQSALTELQKAYRVRGYVTATVGLPQQKLTNATVKVQVTEGRLSNIKIVGNDYFSSNNIMRALPSLHTNIILNGQVFQSELNRANANQDRQIYLPVLSPGPEPATTDLTLRIKDRFPVHGKIELNNQNSPGTPDLRLNASAAYNNLWQREHSLGVQYGFSPEEYKPLNSWEYYDLPLIVNYSGFYRMPLGNPQAVEDAMASRPGNFGYSEAQRRFILPSPSGQAEATIYASRSTIDTGIEDLGTTVIVDDPQRRLTTQQVQQDLTINESLGFRLTEPLRSTETFVATLSQGFEYKTYTLDSYKTNVNTFYEIVPDPDDPQNGTITIVTKNPQPLDPTHSSLEYLPLSMNFNANYRAPRATFNFGLGLTYNAWHSGNKANFETIAGSTNTSAHWLVLDPSLTVDIVVVTNWVMTVRADGRWASDPLISNEQFGAGGIASVRGYHEGEVYGDTGLHLSLEQKTPPYVVGLVHGKLPLTVRGSVYTDYAETYLLDPQGQPGSTDLLSVGLGTVASVGSYWEARFLFSLPLLDAGTVKAYQPVFNFSLTAQF